MALKLIWIKRLLDDNFHTWKHLAKSFLMLLGDAYLFHSNLSLSDRCLHASNKLPTFYQELINLWTKICSTETKNTAEILGQSLWNNKFIWFKDKPIFYWQFSDRGINTISDLITEDCKFLRWSQARDKYKLSNKDVMKWLGLIESIPRDWKSVIKNDSSSFSQTYSISNDVRFLDKTIPLQAITSRIAYTLLTKPLIQKPTAQKSLSELLGTSDINWKDVYQLPHRVTNETSLRVFQYKILNNIVYLNNRLHKFGFVESPLCSLCNREPESILHLFCNCKETQKLWKSVQHWCKNHISLSHLTPKLVLLGDLDSSNSEFVLKNHLILLFKRFVYRSKVNTSGFNFLAFKYHIRYVLKIEQKIACEKGKLSIHFDK